MAKVYTIGRDPSCDIRIDDATDVISRIHATLKDYGGGRYAIIDQSLNGTYINGMRMASNEEIPVSRKDVVSFAHIRDLDWSMIPEESRRTRHLLPILVAIAVLVAGAALYIAIRGCGGRKGATPVVEVEQVAEPLPVQVQPDSTTDTTVVVSAPVEPERPLVRPPRPKKKSVKTPDASDSRQTPTQPVPPAEPKPVEDALL